MYLTVTEIAQMLRIAPGRARVKMERAHILKPGGRIPMEDAVDWVERHSDSADYAHWIAFLERTEKGPVFAARIAAAQENEHEEQE